MMPELRPEAIELIAKKADGSMEEYDHIPGLIKQSKRKIKSENSTQGTN